MTKIAIVAGGCFWGLENLFRDLPGVVDTEAGYTGGENDNPTYENHAGHAEALQIEYDSDKIAEEMINVVNESERWSDSVVTTLERQSRFWPAENYHQDYLLKNPGGYTCHAIYFDSYLDK